MAYLTQAYLYSALEQAKVDALVATGDLPTVIEQAEAETESALTIGGYTTTVPSTTFLSDASNTPKIIKLAAFGAWLELAYGRRDLEVPEAYRAHIRKLEDLRNGLIELVGYPRNVARAPGGVSFSESSTDVSVENGSKPQIFNRSSMSGF